MIQIEQYEIWIADHNPNKGSEPEKTKPVLIVQTNLLNTISHPSTLICPLTTKVEKETKLLRIHLKKSTANLDQDCDIMLDQIRVFDNGRLVEKIGKLPEKLFPDLKRNILIILDL